MGSTDTTSRRRVLTGIGGSLLSMTLAGCTGGSGDTSAGSDGGGEGPDDANDGGSGGDSAGSGSSIDEPEYDGWFDGVDNYGSTVDGTDSETVTIEVGGGSNGYRFDPPAVAVSPGTTVVWEWTGEGGSHNVVAENGDFESDLTNEAGHTFERSVDSPGVVKFFCSPHKAVGMKGAVAVLE